MAVSGPATPSIAPLPKREGSLASFFSIEYDKIAGITEKEIVDVVNSLLDEDCWQLIVPAKVYHAMQKRGRCCGCFPNVVDNIIRTTEQYHARRDSTGDEIFDFMTRLKQFHVENRRADLEWRQKSHRAA